MQGWYTEYCANTGQFCDQVKLKHATKDKKTGAEIVYEVDSSDGFTPTKPTPDPGTQQTSYSEDDIHRPPYLQHDPPPVSGSGDGRKEKKNKDVVKSKRRKALVEKMRQMFHSLSRKYKEKKQQMVTDPRDLFIPAPSTASPRPQPPPSTTARPGLAADTDLSFVNVDQVRDDFYDFVPMEYEVVEDVIIENY